jgi:hypothetical protein
VTPAGRSPAGHRLYDAGATARVDLVRTAGLSQDERQRLIGDFLDAVFGGQDAEPSFAGIRRSVTRGRLTVTMVLVNAASV